jgi:hypothetical protein
MICFNARTIGAMTLSLLVVGVTACVDWDDSTLPANSGEELVLFEDIRFDSAGLQPDPLAGDDWPAGPDLDDVPGCLRNDVDWVVSDDTRLLIFDGSCNGSEYFYRAPVMEVLDDDEFHVAVTIMAARTDRMGKADEGPANGMADGEGSYSNFLSYLYNPDSPIIDPDADFDVSANSDHISDQIDEILSNVGDDDLMVDLTFVPTVRTWQHYVDVLDPAEVASQEVAQDAGEQRRDQFTADLIDISTDGVDQVTGCQEVARSTDTHRAVYSCTVDQVELLTQLPHRVVDVKSVSQIPGNL